MTVNRSLLVIASLSCPCVFLQGLRGDLVFSIRAVDWRLPRRFAPRNILWARCDESNSPKEADPKAPIRRKFL